MKTKQEVRQELMNEFGKNFNNIDNLIKWLKSHYHPQFFTSIDEFSKTAYFHTTENITIDENNAYIKGLVKIDGRIVICLNISKILN